MMYVSRKLSLRNPEIGNINMATIIHKYSILQFLLLTFSTSASCLCCSLSFSSWCLASRTLIFISVWKHKENRKSYVEHYGPSVFISVYKMNGNICLREDIFLFPGNRILLNNKMCVLTFFFLKRDALENGKISYVVIG